MEYLLKVSTVVGIFYLCYKLFLHRDTFFESNRGFLLLGLFTAFTIPFLVIPIYIEYTPAPIQNYDLSGELVTIQNSEKPFDILTYIPLIYFIGLCVFALRFLFQFVSLCRIIIRNKTEKEGPFKLVKTVSDLPPFSFFNWIVYNPNQFNQSELIQILTHEKVHVSQRHSIDILVTQLSCIVLWFNPLIWLYNKALKQNLEFIADQNTQRKFNCKKSYQYTLLKTTMPSHQMALTNNFYNSLIKKRIVMLHKSKSKKIGQTKYLLVVPLLAIFLMSFNTKQVLIEKETPSLELPNMDRLIDTETITSSNGLSQEEEKPSIKSSFSGSNTDEKIILKDSKPKKQKSIGNIETIIISKNTTDTELKKVAKNLNKEGVTIKFKNVKRNDNGEITGMKIKVSSKKSSANYNVNSDDAIKPIKISIKNNGENISIGNADIYSHEGHAFYFKSKDGKHKIHKSGKEDNVFIFSDNDGEHEVHEIHGDAIIHGDTLVYESKGKYQIIKNGKKVKVISNQNIDENVDVIIEHDGNHEEDVIILKKAKLNRLSDSLTNSPLKRIGVNSRVADSLISTNKRIVKSNTLKTNNNLMALSNSLKTNGNDSIHVSLSGLLSKNVLYLLDDEEISENDMHTLDKNKIASITVLKDESAKILYGNKAKNGAILIRSKGNSNTLKALPRLKGINKNTVQISTYSDKYPLYIMNGNEIQKDKLENLNPERIESINVLKGKSAIKKYGNKAKEGVVEITTKKQK